MKGTRTSAQPQEEDSDDSMEDEAFSKLLLSDLNVKSYSRSKNARRRVSTRKDTDLYPASSTANTYHEDESSSRISKPLRSQKFTSGAPSDMSPTSSHSKKPQNAGGEYRVRAETLRKTCDAFYDVGSDVMVTVETGKTFDLRSV